MMYNADGPIYQPAYNANTIVNWNSYAGYVVKLENEVTLYICGSPVDSKMLNLVAGLNVIPVLNDGDVFDAVSDEVVVIREILGTKLWYPAYGIYSLEILMAEKAYLVKVTDDVEITYP